MNTYHSLLFLLAIVLTVKHTFAKVTAETQCKNGYVAQMSNHFECKCNDGFVLANENTCEEKRDCTNPQNVNKNCGDYAVCANTRMNNEERALRCGCILGYTVMNEVCTPNKCNGVLCGKGKCILDPANVNSTMCSCNIGSTLDESKKCGKPGKTECTLKCKANEECKETQNYYKCVAKGSGGEGSGGEGSGGEGSGGEGSGGEGSGGEGSGGDTGAAYSLMNGSAVISILLVFAFFMMSLV
uniref:Ookinete surface protein Pvs28 n=1 Tax=Plasmodium vivax TaxID=5855 RepID=A0A1B0WW45_PLAVI|nr:ookinete surface protein Pvs28 [Plasmodium vivax]